MQLSPSECGGDGLHAQPSAGASLDWPLSRDEKKSCVLKFYEQDVRAANRLLRSGEAALEALRQELAVVRSAGGALDDVGSTTPRDHAWHVAKLDTPRAAPLPSPMTPKRRRVPALRATTAAAIAAAAVELSPPPPADDMSPQLAPRSSGPMTPRRTSTMTSDREVAAEAAERLQFAITNAAAALHVLWGSTADDACESPGADDETGNVRARSEGALRLKEHAPAALRQDGRRHSRGGEGRRVSFADEAVTCKGTHAASPSPCPPRRSSISEPEPEVPSTPERGLASPRPRRSTSPELSAHSVGPKPIQRPFAIGKVPTPSGKRLGIALGGGVKLHCNTPRAQVEPHPSRSVEAPPRRLLAVQDAPRSRAVPVGVMDFF